MISIELLRNLLLATACVTFTTLMLLADVRSCFIVILSVIMSLVSCDKQTLLSYLKIQSRVSVQVDVAGVMWLWGMTIDIVASTNMIISVGLCVDFSAHITHSFMIQK